MSVDKLIDAIEAFRQYNAEIQAQTILTFLYAAEQPGITLQRLNDKLRVSLSATSRNVYALSALKKGSESGFGLLDIMPNPDNRREKIVTVTSKGERFYASLRKVVGSSDPH